MCCAWNHCGTGEHYKVSGQDTARRTLGYREVRVPDAWYRTESAHPAAVSCYPEGPAQHGSGQRHFVRGKGTWVVDHVPQRSRDTRVSGLWRVCLLLGWTERDLQPPPRVVGFAGFMVVSSTYEVPSPVVPMSVWGAAGALQPGVWPPAGLYRWQRRRVLHVHSLPVADWVSMSEQTGVSHIAMS